MQKYTEESVCHTDNLGNKRWMLNGIFHREDGPAVERTNGDKYWYYQGRFHREDGPAIEYASGTKEWRINGMLHRLDGPALEYSDGHKEWYINGLDFSSEEKFIKHKQILLLEIPYE